MKYFLGSLLSFIISISTFAQNSLGVDYYSLGETKLAKEYFQKEVAQNPAQAYYYLGEIAFQEGNLADAKANYEKGLAADPESAYNAIGMAKLDLKSNTKEAENQLSAIIKKNKKDIDVVLAVAKAYADNGMKDKTDEKVQEARKIDKKSPASYIFQGDMLAKGGKLGDAAMEYDQAINFDPNSLLAYIKGARVYESINATTAIDLLKKAKDIRPDYAVTYKYLGKIYADNGFFPESIEAYKTFFAQKNYSLEDIKKYAGAEYYLKDYDKIISLAKEGLAMSPDDFILNRLLMYSYNAKEDYSSALTAANKFFSLPKASDVNYIVQDYMTYANILGETGDKAGSIAQYKKAIELDPSKIDTYKEIATICANENMNVEAADFYQKYVDKSGDKAEATDFFQLGRYYYYAGSEKAKDADAAVKEQGVSLLKQADATFSVLIDRVADSYLGYYWRARTNALLDPDTDKGFAKPYYEQTIEKILAKDDQNNNKILIEAYSYLSYYYYLQFDKTKKAEDKENVKKYAQKVLELDATNANGKALFDFASGTK